MGRSRAKAAERAGTAAGGDLLEKAAVFYRKALAESPEALGWLRERGLRNPVEVRRHGIENLGREPAGASRSFRGEDPP